MRWAALLGAVATFAPALQARWIRLDSGPFQLFSEGSEKPARDTLARLDLARRVFAGLVPNARATPLPIRVFVLPENRFRAVRPGEITRAFYQGAAERDSIILPSDANPRALFHEYVHLVLHHTSGPLPKWLEEGLAEFHSTLTVREDAARQDKVRLGTPIADHLRLLAASRLMTGTELLAVNRDSPQFNQAAHAGLFYAQSWAFVHMLRLGESYRGRFGSFVDALESGQAQGAAFQRAFGKSASEAMADLASYLDRSTLPVLDLSVELGGARDDARRVEISELDGDVAFAQLARDCGRPTEAEKAFLKLARTQPGTPQGEAALAFVALSQNRRDEARARLDAALAAGSRDPQVAFELATLLRETGVPSPRSRELLERTVEWNPMFAEAQFLLGVDDAHQGRHQQAIARIEQAIAVFPRQSYFWHALSLSLRALGKPREAKDAARRALDCAETSSQVEMARAALDAADPPAAALPRTAPAVETPASWQRRQGGETVDGVLEQIDCLGRSARFHIKAATRRLALWVDNPGEVLLKNLSSVTFEFRCGPQKPVPVAVEFERRPDTARGTIGVVTAIEFR